MSEPVTSTPPLQVEGEAEVTFDLGTGIFLHPGPQTRTAGFAAIGTEVERLLAMNRRAFRCVAIVHGRGLHSEGNIAVLRTEVRLLLRAHPAVLAYADAPRDDGGTGAVYVLLRG